MSPTDGPCPVPDDHKCGTRAAVLSVLWNYLFCEQVQSTMFPDVLVEALFAQSGRQSDAELFAVGDECAAMARSY